MRIIAKVLPSAKLTTRLSWKTSDRRYTSLVHVIPKSIQERKLLYSIGRNETGHKWCKIFSSSQKVREELSARNMQKFQKFILALKNLKVYRQTNGNIGNKTRCRKVREDDPDSNHKEEKRYELVRTKTLNGPRIYELSMNGNMESLNCGTQVLNKSLKPKFGFNENIDVFNFERNNHSLQRREKLMLLGTEGNVMHSFPIILTKKHYSTFTIPMGGRMGSVVKSYNAEILSILSKNAHQSVVTFIIKRETSNGNVSSKCKSTYEIPLSNFFDTENMLMKSSAYNEALIEANKRRAALQEYENEMELKLRGAANLRPQVFIIKDMFKNSCYNPLSVMGQVESDSFDIKNNSRPQVRLVDKYQPSKNDIGHVLKGLVEQPRPCPPIIKAMKQASSDKAEIGVKNSSSQEGTTLKGCNAPNDLEFALMSEPKPCPPPVKSIKQADGGCKKDGTSKPPLCEDPCKKEMEKVEELKNKMEEKKKRKKPTGCINPKCIKEDKCKKKPKSPCKSIPNTKLSGTIQSLRQSSTKLCKSNVDMTASTVCQCSHCKEIRAGSKKCASKINMRSVKSDKECRRKASRTKQTRKAEASKTDTKGCPTLTKDPCSTKGEQSKQAEATKKDIKGCPPREKGPCSKKGEQSIKAEATKKDTKGCPPREKGPCSKKGEQSIKAEATKKDTKGCPPREKGPCGKKGEQSIKAEATKKDTKGCPPSEKGPCSKKGEKSCSEQSVKAAASKTNIKVSPSKEKGPVGKKAEKSSSKQSVKAAASKTNIKASPSKEKGPVGKKAEKSSSKQSVKAAASKPNIKASPSKEKGPVGKKAEKSSSKQSVKAAASKTNIKASPSKAKRPVGKKAEKSSSKQSVKAAASKTSIKASPSKEKRPVGKKAEKSSSKQSVKAAASKTNIKASPSKEKRPVGKKAEKSSSSQQSIKAEPCKKDKGKKDKKKDGKKDDKKDKCRDKDPCKSKKPKDTCSKKDDKKDKCKDKDPCKNKKPKDTCKSEKPKDTCKSKKPKDTCKSKKPKDTCKSEKPKDTCKSEKPKDTCKSKKPKDTCKSEKPKDTCKSKKPKDTCKSEKPKDTCKSKKPKDTCKSEKPKDTCKSEKPKDTCKSKKPKDTCKSEKPKDPCKKKEKVDKKDDICKKREPCKGGQPKEPCKKGGDKKDPSKKQDPCKKKEDSSCKKDGSQTKKKETKPNCKPSKKSFSTLAVNRASQTSSNITNLYSFGFMRHFSSKKGGKGKKKDLGKLSQCKMVATRVPPQRRTARNPHPKDGLRKCFPTYDMDCKKLCKDDRKTDCKKYAHLKDSRTKKNTSEFNN